MEIFNIGPVELLLFLMIAFLLLGPKDMVLTAYKIGEQIRKFVRSPVWREILRSAQDIRELPTKLMDETGLKETVDAIKKDTQDTVKEVNSSMNEAIGDMRVPEAEHIRLETEPKIEPAMRTVPVLAPPRKLPGEVDGAPIPSSTKPVPQEVQPEDSAAKVEPPAVEDQPVVSEMGLESAAVEQPAAEDQPTEVVVAPQEAKPKRASRKKADQPVEGAGAVSESLPAETEISAPRRTPRRKAQATEAAAPAAESPEAKLPEVEAPEAETPVFAEAVVAEPEPPMLEPEVPVIKRRASRKKTGAVDLPIEAEASESEPPAMLVVNPLETLTIEETPEETKAPRSPRRKKAVVVVEPSPAIEDTAVQAAPRRTRARKNGSGAEDKPQE